MKILNEKEDLKVMIVEKIIFSILALYLFLLMFFKMIKKIDAAYIVLLVLQAIGIALSFVEIIFILKFNIIIKTIIYLLSIIIPLIVIFLERKGKNFSELIYIGIANFYKFTRKHKKMQRSPTSCNR